MSRSWGRCASLPSPCVDMRFSSKHVFSRRAFLHTPVNTRRMYGSYMRLETHVSPNTRRMYASYTCFACTCKHAARSRDVWLIRVVLVCPQAVSSCARASGAIRRIKVCCPSVYSAVLLPERPGGSCGTAMVPVSSVLAVRCRLQVDGARPCQLRLWVTRGAPCTCSRLRVLRLLGGVWELVLHGGLHPCPCGLTSF